MGQWFQRTRATKRKRKHRLNTMGQPKYNIEPQKHPGVKAIKSLKTKLKDTRLGRINAKGENKFLNNKNSQNASIRTIKKYITKQ